MRKQHNVKSSALAYLPPEMREFVKPTRVAHVWTRTTFLADEGEVADTVRYIKENHHAVAVFHKARRNIAK